jgi:NitT/TauT family transport system substrate-binding protein
LVSLLVVTMAGCAPAAPPAAAPTAPSAAAPTTPPAPVPAPTAPPLTTVVQALPVDSFGFAPLYVARAKGFYAAEGLDLQTPLMSSSTAVAGMSSGQVHFASAGTGVRAAMQGLPIKVISYYYNTTLFELVVRPEITSIADLKGKALGTSSRGSTEEITASVMLRQAGIDPTRDVTFVVVAAGTQLPTMLTGAVSGMMLNPDLSAESARQGMRVLASVEDVGRLIPAPFSGFVVSDETLQKRPEMVKAWLRANIKALQYTRANPTEAATIIGTALKMEPEVAQSAVKKAIQAINPDDLGGFSEAGFAGEIQNNLAAMGNQATKTAIADLTDVTLLRQAQRELGVPCKTGYQCVAPSSGAATAATPVAQAAPAKAPTKITMALPTLDVGFLPSVVASSKGFFREEGLDVDMPVMRSIAAVPALTSKQIQFAVAGSSTRAAYEGAPLKTVFYSYHENTLIGVGSKDVTSFQDLKGKVLAVASPGSSEDFATKRILALQKIPVADVRLVAIGSGAERATAMIAGQVNFTIVNADVAVDLERRGFTILGDLRTMMPIPFSGFSVHEDTLRDQPAMVKAWLRAHVRALKFIVDNPQAAADIAARELKLEPSLANRAVELILPAISTDDLGGFTQDALILNTQQDLEALKRTDDPLPLGTRVHDITLLRQAQQELGLPCKGGYKCP